MASLDVSEALTDSLIGDSVTLVRRRQPVSDSGRAVPVEQVIPNVFGVVTSAGPNDLERPDDMETMGRVMSFVTRFKVWGPAEIQGTQYQPDVIRWKGVDYVVITVDPYPQYGSGFVQVIMGSLGAIDPPTTDGSNNIGTLDFSTPDNSSMLGVI